MQIPKEPLLENPILENLFPMNIALVFLSNINPTDENCNFIIIVSNKDESMDSKTILCGIIELIFPRY
jgi:hypothetical protein